MTDVMATIVRVTSIAMQYMQATYHHVDQITFIQEQCNVEEIILQHHSVRYTTVDQVRVHMQQEADIIVPDLMIDIHIMEEFVDVQEAYITTVIVETL